MQQIDVFWNLDKRSIEMDMQRTSNTALIYLPGHPKRGAKIVLQPLLRDGVIVANEAAMVWLVLGTQAKRVPYDLSPRVAYYVKLKNKEGHIRVVEYEIDDK
jgi:hypothetical protein